MTLTVAYMTSRRYPCWQWFFDRLRRQDGEQPNRIIVVDLHQAERPNELPPHITHVPPKPTVWQGTHRLTTRDYFAAANARNTALCLAPDGWIAYVDDLSVLLPGWLAAVRQAMQTGYVALGAYRKVLGLEVVDGEVRSFVDHPSGHDSRWGWGKDDRAVRQGAGAFFGCSVAMPIELLLRVNGWDEGLCDGMGYEDAAMGLRLDRIGADMRYDRRMLTYESEEMHHVGEPMIRVDKKIDGPNGPDASHAMLRQVREISRSSADNKHLVLGIRWLRGYALVGSQFPVPTMPTHHWPDNQPLAEM